MWTNFHWDEALLRKKIQNGRLKKKLQFSTPSILNIFHENFILVSRLVGLNDAKGIDVAHPIWL